MLDLEIITLNKKDIQDFSLERNKLLDITKSKWVLFLDSDEKLDKPINEISDEYDGYILRRRNYFLNKYVGTDEIVRLAKKDAGNWKREVHEVWNIRSNKIGRLDNIIIHNTSENLSSYLNKINFYSGLHAKANMKEHKTSTIFKMVFFPIFKFLITLLKSKNVVFSIMQSLHSFLSWTKLYFLQS